jgi:hypothetical protein
MYVCTCIAYEAMNKDTGVLFILYATFIWRACFETVAGFMDWGKIKN